MSEPVSTGSSTVPAATPATAQAPPPSTAAASSQPAQNTPATTAPSGRRDYSVKKPGSSGEMTASSGLSTMLHAVSENYFSANRNLRVPNHIVPNCTMFYQILGQMDTQMSHTKRFIDANPDWHFFVTQLYHGILIFYFTLTNQSVGNQISDDQRLFLEYMDNQFSVKYAKIPGPAVPFYQSLAACSGPDSRYGNVTFSIPNNLEVTQNNHFLAINRFNAHLPSLILILDQFMRYINALAPVGAAPQNANMAMADQFYFNIFGRAAADNEANRVNMKTPNARVSVGISLANVTAFLGTADLWRSVLPFSAATNESTYVHGNSNTILGFDQVIGLRGFGTTVNQVFAWIPEVMRIAQPYADFFKDSVSLGAISTNGIGVCYVETRLLNTVANAQMLTADVTVRNVRYSTNATPRYVIPNLTDLEVSCAYREDNLDLVAEQMGMLSQLNTEWSVNQNVLSIFPGPILGNVRIGTVWNRPVTSATRTIQVLRYTGALISGYYHVPASGKFGH